MKVVFTLLARRMIPLAFLLTAMAPSEASPFRNLDFDEADAYAVSFTDFGPRLGFIEDLLPGWSFAPVNGAPGNYQLGVDAPGLGTWGIVYTTNIAAHVSPVLGPEFGPQQPFEIVVEGRNSFTMESFYPTGFLDLSSISQTGDIPPATESLHFLNYGEGIDVFVNGSFVPSVYRPRAGSNAPVADVYTDISSFAGKTVELRFRTSDRLSSGIGLVSHGLDSIAFSSEKLTEAQLFTRVTEGAIARDLGAFNACAWGDASNDGYAGVFTGNLASGKGAMYRNNNDGTFTQVLFAAGEITTGVSWGDYNNDSYLDPLRTFSGSGGGIRLQVNGGNDLELTGASQDSTTPAAANPAAGDFDNDGWLDFVVCTRSTIGDALLLYRNLGGLQFQDSPLTAGPSPALLHYAPVCGDYDNDGRLDIFVAAEGDQDFLLHNRGAGIFERAAGSSFELGSGFSVAAAWGDYDNDGYLDLVVVSKQPSSNVLYHNNHDGTFSKVASASLGSHTGQSLNCAWGDYDNDGFLDLFIVNQGETSVLYHNNGDGSFTAITPPELTAATNSASCAWADYDNDGNLDLLVASSAGSNFLYRNNGTTNGWLKVRCYGTVSNSAAIGAKVRVEARIFGRTLRQMREVSGGNGRSQNDLALNFGLGDAASAQVVTIEWPSGLTQEFRNVAARQSLVVHEPVLGFGHAQVVQGQFQATLIGRSGSPKTLQVSADLRQWTTVVTLTNFNNGRVFSQSIGDGAQQFYRISE